MVITSDGNNGIKSNTVTFFSNYFSTQTVEAVFSLMGAMGGGRNNRTGAADWLRKNRVVMVKPIT